jgi:hypothetical protein
VHVSRDAFVQEIVAAACSTSARCLYEKGWKTSVGHAGDAGKYGMEKQTLVQRPVMSDLVSRRRQSQADTLLPSRYWPGWEVSLAGCATATPVTHISPIRDCGRSERTRSGQESLSLTGGQHPCVFFRQATRPGTLLPDPLMLVEQPYLSDTHKERQTRAAFIPWSWLLIFPALAGLAAYPPTCCPGASMLLPGGGSTQATPEFSSCSQLSVRARGRRTFSEVRLSGYMY